MHSSKLFAMRVFSCFAYILFVQKRTFLLTPYADVVRTKSERHLKILYSTQTRGRYYISFINLLGVLFLQRIFDRVARAEQTTGRVHRKTLAEI